MKGVNLVKFDRITPGQKKQRECLKCRKPFLSRDFSNRLCAKCDGENESIRELEEFHVPKSK